MGLSPLLNYQRGMTTEMKTLYMIGGTMGSGKTTVCRALKSILDFSVFLDGDWCWDMNPFTVNTETKRVVMDNIVYVINNFIHCSAYKNIIFCWVMHEQAIIDELLSRFDISGCEVKCISLILSEDSLKKRLKKDIDAKMRKPDILEKSVSRLPLYKQLNTQKLDVSEISPFQAAEIISRMKL